MTYFDFISVHNSYFNDIDLLCLMTYLVLDDLFVSDIDLLLTIWYVSDFMTYILFDDIIKLFYYTLFGGASICVSDHDLHLI